MDDKRPGYPGDTTSMVHTADNGGMKPLDMLPLPAPPPPSPFLPPGEAAPNARQLRRAEKKAARNEKKAAQNEKKAAQNEKKAAQNEKKAAQNEKKAARDENKAALRDGNKAALNEKKAARRAEPLALRILWRIIYVLMGMLLITAAYIIVIQFVYTGNELPYEAPPAFSPPPVSGNMPDAAPEISSAPAPESTAAPEPVSDGYLPGGVLPSTDISDPQEGDPLPAASARPVTRPVYNSTSAPVQITFTTPRIQCEVWPVQLVGDSIGTINSPTIAAWYEGSAMPDEDGNCIINGHVKWNSRKGAFAYIRDEMQTGEEVVVKLYDGTYAYYEVYSIEEYPYNDFPAHHSSKAGRKRLTLITCKGDYSQEISASVTRIIAVCFPKTGEPIPEWNPLEEV